MKKEMILLAASALLTLSVTGCGAGANTELSDSSTAESTDNESDDASSEVSLDGKSAGDSSPTEKTADGQNLLYDAGDYVPDKEPDYSITKTIHDDPQNDTSPSYQITYELYLMDETNAIARETYRYTSFRTSCFTYVCTYTQTDDSIIASYTGSSEYDGDVHIIFSLENGSVTDASEFYDDLKILDAKGTYTGNDEVLGDLTLEIGTAGNATLTTQDDVVYTGSISMVNDRFDLMVSNEDLGDSYDWYIDLDKDTFSHEVFIFGTSDFSAYVGDYDCFGSLGQITITIDEDGAAYTTIDVDGQTLDFHGWAYLSDEGDLSSIYMDNDQGYSLSLDMVYLGGEDGWNYSGTITSPLSAG